MLRAHRRGESVDPGGKREQKRPCRTMAGSYQCLWIHSPLVKTALTRHDVPEMIRNLILDYYNSFRLRVSSGTVTSAWQWLEKGIITGSTISVALFALAMNMIVKSAEVECRGPMSGAPCLQLPEGHNCSPTNQERLD